MENAKTLSDSVEKVSLTGEELIIGLDGREIKIKLSVLKTYLGISATGNVVPAKVPGLNLGAPADAKFYVGGPGTYTLDGVAEQYSDVVNFFFWDKSSWEVLEIPIVVPPSENKIPDWIPGTYFGGAKADQRVNNNQVWKVKSNVASTTQEPSLTSSDWESIGANKEIQEDIIRSFFSTDNLFDKLKTQRGYWTDTGAYNSSPNSISTPKMKIDATREFISINENSSIGVANKVNFYNAGGGIISWINRSRPGGLQGIAIPENSDSFTINIATQAGGISTPSDNQWVNNLMINYGLQSKPFVNYDIAIQNGLLGKSIADTQSNTNTISKITQQSPNLIDKSKVTYGYWRDTGEFTNSASTISTPKIKRDPTKTFLSINENSTLGVTNKVNFYDENDQLISVILKSASLQAIPFPAGTDTFIVNITSQTGGVGDSTNNQWVNNLQAEYGEKSTPFKDFGLMAKQYESDGRSASIKINVRAATAFDVISTHDNGDEVTHTFTRNVKVEQYDDAWRAMSIIYKGNDIVQGSFNFIHQIGSFPNEETHVGTGHGCETMLYCHFYIDGKEFTTADNIGNQLTGEVFSFDIGSVIYAVDYARTIADYNGANAVPKLPLIESTKHYMNGFIGRNSKTGLYNKLVVLRDATTFHTAYLGMHFPYKEFFDRIQLHNIENTINDYQTHLPISPATAALLGSEFDTAEGWRGELATAATTYSDRFGYIFKTRCFVSDEIAKKMRVQIASTGKAYFHPVETGVRGIPADVFNRGDVIEGYIERELILSPQ